MKQQIPEKPNSSAPRTERDTFKKHDEDALDVSCLMLITMEPDLQKQHENMGTFDMIEHLKLLFQEQARHERYETSKELFRCRMSEVLQLLPNSYSQFVMNYNMHDFDKSLPTLLNMLRTAEQELAKNKSTILMVRKDKKGKSKGKSIAKPTSKSLKPKGGIKKPKVTVPKEGECFYCNKPGHWKMNCPLYVQEKKKGSVTSTLGIYVIEDNLSTSYTSWVLDIGCGSHICRNVQELKRTRRLSKGEVNLRVGNGAKVVVIAVGSILLTLSTGLLLELDDCYCVPYISRNLISVSCLDKKGFTFSIGNKCCSFSFGNIHYGDASLINGLYVLNMDNLIYNIDKRDIKSNNSNLTYLWHCRLGHINETRISKLHKDGLLNKLDFESYGTCETSLIGKMTKAPFVGQIERASDVLGIIHSDVCGPMNIHARGGYRYFITFTDDLSRFGYVYLMRHKSESFEMFKEFQNDLQNQLGKSITILRFDRGGEYLDHAFLDHLRNCGIVSQLTPPRTPQWNGVSERRNRYPKETIGYYFYHPHDNKVFVGRTGVFMEKEFISKSISGRNVELEVVQDQNISIQLELTQTSQVIVDPQSDVERQSDVVTQSARRSSRKRNEPERYGFLITHTGDVMLMDDESTSYQDAMASTNSEKWLDAMRIEMDSMYENQVWNLIDPPNEQASRSWNHRFDEAIKEFGFSKNEDEPCVYKKAQRPTTSQEIERMSKIPYVSAIGSIMYAMICTRPDVSYALSMTSRYQSNPGDGHWIAVKNILKYLRRTNDSFLVYGGEEELSVKGYTDASFQTDKDDFRSQSGFVFCLNGGAVSWKSSKQATLVDSTTEAEYIAASDATKETVWIKTFISQLGVVPSSDCPIELLCDNNGAIAQAKEPRSLQRSKHILRRYHLIREIIKRGDVSISRMSTDNNVVDPLTKPLTKQKHDGYCRSIGIRWMDDWL
ncbi:hypothetical protein L6452_17683 [Arctium lappa]|uniref:Uncharacterized protein n=1 Tax=Arctium lappa TaxID=4217 RepID=A0ACB9C439_ARCLA|nr:hypothetical protein L6452_17683 [Arctium lappa]